MSVYAALRREADSCTDGRSRGQVMADVLVERVTGRSTAVPTPIAVNLVLSDETLMGHSDAPADVSGYGPIPAAVARELILGAVGDQRSRATLRPTLCAAGVGRIGGNGVQSPAISPWPGGLYRVSGSMLPYALL